MPSIRPRCRWSCGSIARTPPSASSRARRTARLCQHLACGLRAIKARRRGSGGRLAAALSGAGQFKAPDAPDGGLLDQVEGRTWLRRLSGSPLQRLELFGSMPGNAPGYGSLVNGARRAASSRMMIGVVEAQRPQAMRLVDIATAQHGAGRPASG